MNNNNEQNKNQDQNGKMAKIQSFIYFLRKIFIDVVIICFV